MATRIQLRRDISENWSTNNPILALGEMGIETDTNKFKFGDGENSWNALDYASGINEDTNFSYDFELESMKRKSLENGFLWYVDNTSNTKAQIRANSNYAAVKYDVSDLIGKKVHVFTKWISADPNIPLVMFVDTAQDNLIISKVIYGDVGGTNVKVTIDTDYTVPEGCNELWIGSSNAADITNGWADYTTKPTITYTDTLNNLLGKYVNDTTVLSYDRSPTEVFDTYFVISNNKISLRASNPLYFTNCFAVSPGEILTVKTRWVSRDNVPIIAFTDDTNTVIEKREYTDYGTAGSEVTVNETFTTPAGSTKLYVSYGASFDVATVTMKNPALKTKTIAEISTDVATSLVEEKISELNPYKPSIRILFIGNSLTQDGVSYMPTILKQLVPQLDFKICMWYMGGYTLEQQLQTFNNHGKASIFSVANNTSYWSNYESSKTIEDALAEGPFDIICLQEYFTYKDSYGAADLQTFRDILDYIDDTVNYSYKVAELFHQPHLTQDKPSYGHIDIDDRFEFAVESTKLMWNNLPISSIIPTGIASYRATKTSLNSLGDVGGLSPDYTHCQEGFPCTMLAYVTTMWLLDQVGLPGGIINNRVRVETTDAFNAIHVPGPNLGSGLVTATAAQYRLGQEIAVNAIKECKATFKYTIPEE